MQLDCVFLLGVGICDKVACGCLISSLLKYLEILYVKDSSIIFVGNSPNSTGLSGPGCTRLAHAHPTQLDLPRESVQRKVQKTGLRSGLFVDAQNVPFPSLSQHKCIYSL